MRSPLKDKIISLRISKQDFSSIEIKANEEDVTVSALIRQLIQQGLNKKVIHSSPNLSNSEAKRKIKKVLKKYNLGKGRKTN